MTMISVAFDRRCAELYTRAKLSTHAIARSVKSSQGRVARAIKRRGVKPRGFSEAVKLVKDQQKKEKQRGSQGKN